MIETRPWGTYEVLLDKPDHKVKEICLKPNHRFSLQYHEHREEHWVVVKCSCIITQDDGEGIISPGEYAYIPKGTIHRLCGGEEGITLIEVQRGICEEDDIVRIEVYYGRLEK